MRNGKLVGPTHCDATNADSMQLKSAQRDTNPRAGTLQPDRTF